MPLDEHQLDEEGDHDPEQCELCVERALGHSGTCDCGRCCEGLIVEASPRDAEREPGIAQHGRPIKDSFASDEVVGYMLNDVRRGCCTFFDQVSRRCTIYETRPLVCRVFECEDWSRENPPRPVSSLSLEERQAVVQRIRRAIAATHECVAMLTDDDAMQLAYAVAASITELHSLGHITYPEWYELIDALWAPGSRLHALKESLHNRRS